LKLRLLHSSLTRGLAGIIAIVGAVHVCAIGKPDEVGDGHEPVAAGSQPGDDLVERGDSLEAVGATAVVQQDDLVPVGGVEDAAADCRGTAPP
jgi:hypothetical protein